MDRLFGSWWPWGQTQSPKLSTLLTTTAVTLEETTSTRHKLELITTTVTIIPVTSTLTTISSITLASSTSITDSPLSTTTSNFTINSNLTNIFFDNITILIENFTNNNNNFLSEDELLYGGMWNCNNTADINCSLINSEQNYNDSNVTFINNSDSDRTRTEFETTVKLITMIATAIVLGIIILATVIGNVFVIAAILLERNLQSVANYLILSLAVADLLVACLVMPLGAVYEVSQEWRMGPELCDMWTSSDVLCCTASILHLVCIALDRYWAVTNIDYVHQRTAHRIGIMILVVWALSFFVSIAPLLGWKDPDWDTRLSNLQCIVSQDLSYQIFATASSFFLPLLVILVLYWRIFQTARKRIRRRQQGVYGIRATQAAQTHPEPLANASCLALTPLGFRWKVSGDQPPPGGLIASAAGGSGGIAAAVVAVIGRPLPTISETTTAFTNVSSANTSPEKGSIGNGVDRVECDPPTDTLSVAYPSHGASILKPSNVSRKKNQNSADSKRERKAAKTLAIITGAFVCCWLPFFILAILLPTCDSCNISPLIMSFFLWLGYFNSTLNPIIYTIFSPEFRHAFKRLLCGRRNSIRRRTRHLGVRR